MVTVTVGAELLPADEQGDWPAAPLAPPAPTPPPPGQVATVPTVSMRPPTVVTPSGSTTVTASPALTRYSSLTSRSRVTTGVGLVAVRTTLPAPWDGAPGDGVTEATRIGPGSKNAPPSGIWPVACSPSARCIRSTAAAVADE